MPGDPLFINASAGAPSYTASELRRAFAVLLQPQSANRFGAVQGVRPGGGVITSLSGSTITVAAHGGVISPDLTTTQGSYLYQLPVAETHALTAAHLTLARTDLVVMRIDDNDEDASGARQAISAYVVGTAGAGVPALPARTWELARIAVPASGGGSPSLTERAKFTVAAGGVLPVRDSADLPNHYEGRAVVQADTDRLLVSDGAAWQRVGHYSSTGRTGWRVRRVANQSIATNTTAEVIAWDTEDQDTDGFIAATSATVTIPAGLGGLYALTVVVTGAIGAGRAYVQFSLSTSLTGLPTTFRTVIDANEDRGLVSVTIPLLAADQIAVEVFHVTGSSVNFTGWFSGLRLGA